MVSICFLIIRSKVIQLSYSDDNKYNKIDMFAFLLFIESDKSVAIFVINSAFVFVMHFSSEVSNCRCNDVFVIKTLNCLLIWTSESIAKQVCAFLLLVTIHFTFTFVFAM